MLSRKDQRLLRPCQIAHWKAAWNVVAGNQKAHVKVQLGYAFVDLIDNLLHLHRNVVSNTQYRRLKHWH